MRPMDRLDLIARRVVVWAEREPGIRAMFWFGSFSIGCSTAYSDLDAAFLLSNDVEYDSVIKDLGHALGADCRYTAGSAQSGRASLWVGEELVKVEIVMARSPEGLAWLADADDVSSPRLVHVFDRDGAGDDIIRRAQLQKEINVELRVNQEIEKFLIGFEACSSAHRRSDAYGHYFEYNLALGRLARLMQLARGRPQRLYLPPQLTNTCLELPERQRFWELAGTMKLGQVNAAKRRLLEAFLDIVIELSGRIRLDRTVEELREFGEAIITRDFFWNVRDWSMWTEGWISSGVLFRAGTLTRWQHEPFLQQWLRENGVCTLIDLRNDVEVRQAPYDAGLLDGIDYFQIPLSDGFSDSDQVVMTPEVCGDRYRDQAMSSLPQIVRVFGHIAESAGAVVVHCHIGRDRTGWMLALLGVVLGVPVRVLEDDYLASGMNTSPGTIGRFVEGFGGQKGSRDRLIQAGLKDDMLEIIRARLLTNYQHMDG